MRGHGGAKGKEYGTKEVRRAGQRRGEICNKGQEGWEVGGRWEHSTVGEEQSGTGCSQARKIRRKCWEEQRCVNT